MGVASTATPQGRSSLYLATPAIERVEVLGIFKFYGGHTPAFPRNCHIHLGLPATRVGTLCQIRPRLDTTNVRAEPSTYVSGLRGATFIFLHFQAAR